MLGSEGELGRWEMPTAEPDTEQEVKDNLQTLANATIFLNMVEDLKAEFPKKKIVFQKDGERISANNLVMNTWYGIKAGTLVQLSHSGYYDQAMEVLKLIKNEGNA